MSKTQAEKNRLNITGCAARHNDSGVSSTPVGSFLWSRDEQGTILSAFYWGYIFTQVITGEL